MPRSAVAPQRIAALVFAVALGLLLATPRQALAHLHLRHSSPADKAILDTVPSEIRLVFTEAPQLAVSRVRLLGANGSEIPLGALSIDPDSATALLARIAAGRLTAGSYTVVWRTASSDGHPMEGRFGFTIAEGAVGLAVAPQPAASAGDSAFATPESAIVAAPASAAADQGNALPSQPDIQSPLYVAIRWLCYAALAVLTGTVVFVLLVAPRVPSIRHDVLPGAARMATAAAILLALAWLARLIAEDYALGNVGIGAILSGTTWGRAWIVGAAGALVAIGSAMIALRNESRAGWTVLALAVLAATVALPLSGHALATPRFATLAVVADTLHVLAEGGWLGTLLVTVIAGLPVTLRGAPGTRGREASALVSAFSPVALSCAALLVVTGTLAAALHLGSFGALWGSRYGEVLLIKLAVIAGLLVVAFINWRVLRPRLGTDAATRRIRGSAVAELGLAVIVLVVTAVLVATPPASESPVMRASAVPARSER